MDDARIEAAASYLVGQRQSDAIFGDSFPAGLRPRDWEEVSAIQLATMRLLGPVGGWKVGAHDKAAIPIASPLPLTGILSSPATIESRLRGVECEISFQLGHALPPRQHLYSAADIVAAISSCQATIEIVSARFNNHSNLDKLSLAADLGAHQGLCVGAPAAAWTPDMFAQLDVDLTVDGTELKKRVGSNPGGTDLIRLLVWLANCEVVRKAGGLDAGAVITTGSWTGLDHVPAAARVTARFAAFPPVEIVFV